MRRITGLKAGLVIGMAILAGCGPEKELPKEVTISPSRDTTPSVPVPEKSEKAAAEVVERCLKASTEGHPERIGKLKANRATLKGSVVRPLAGGGKGIVPTFRRIEAVWPDRYSLHDEYNDSGPVRMIVGIRQPSLWIRTQRDGGPLANTDPPDPQKAAESVGVDLIARHWMALLTPLADSKVIAFDAKKQVVDGQKADTVKVSIPNYPVFTLWFNEKTGYLGRVDFHHLEYLSTTPLWKVYTFDGHRPFGGVMVPTKIIYRQSHEVAEDWSVDSWEFPDNVPDAAFEPPVEVKK